MQLLDIPIELLKTIIGYIDNEASIYATIRTCHLLYNLGIDELYLVNADRGSGSCCDWAALHGRVETLRRALSLGLCIGTNDRLYDAVSNGHLEVLQFFIDSDTDGWVTASLNFFDCSGVSLLDLASDNGDLPVVQALLSLCTLKEESIAIHLAVAKGHFNVVLTLLENGADISIADSSGQTPLHIAVVNQHHDELKLLLERGGDVNALDTHQCTPLHMAAKIGNMDITSSLLDYGANLSARDDTGFTAFLHAVDQGQHRTVQMLLNRGADVNDCTADDMGSTALHLASMKSQRADTIDILLERGAAIFAQDACGWTALYRAVEANQIRYLKAFYDKMNGLNLPWDRPDAEPLLSVAASRGSVEIARFLLDRGAGVEDVDKWGCTALTNAAFDGHTAMIRFLLERGACSTRVSTSKWTAIDAAALGGYVEAGRTLLEHMASNGISGESGDRSTPMQTASSNGHVDFVQLLLEYQPNAFTTTGPNGRLPIHAAAANGHIDLLRLFFTLPGFDIDCKDATGRSPLFLAARSGQVDAVSFLLANKASPLIRDIYGASAIFAAARNGHKMVLQQLVSADPQALYWQDHLGHTPFWWISRSGPNKFVKFAKRLALDNGMTEAELEFHVGRREERKFDNNEAWCDVCTRCVTDCKTAVHCTACCDDDFMICWECDSWGMTCLEPAHSIDQWERKAGCFQCRLSDNIDKPME